MAVTRKTRIVIYESNDRIAAIEEAAKALRCSRAELYRRAMRLYLVGKKGKKGKTNVS